MSLGHLKRIYRSRRQRICERLDDFKKAGAGDPASLFEELCFCLLTPQSKAEACDRIIADLKRRGLLLRGSRKSIRPLMKRTRFYRKKTDYLLAARKWFFKKGAQVLAVKLRREGPAATREWLVKNVKGLGYKEASHFLRNIGCGEELAILDIHILRRLQEYGAIPQIPASLTYRRYLAIEGQLKRFSKKSGIPPAHLDLLFWSMATGKIFK